MRAMILGYASDWVAPQLEENDGLLPVKVVRHVDRLAVILFAGIILFVLGILLIWFV